MFIRISIYLFYLIAILLQGCINQSADIYSSDVIEDRKIQESRQGSITKDKKLIVEAIATHLNKVDNSVYRNKEYFFVEVFSMRAIFQSDLIEFSMFGDSPDWVREIKPDEYDDILHVSNKWSKGFLVAFKKVRSSQSQKIQLTMDVYNIGKIVFDFSYHQQMLF